MLFSLKGLRLFEPADHVKNVVMQRVVSTLMSLTHKTTLVPRSNHLFWSRVKTENGVFNLVSKNEVVEFVRLRSVVN